MKSLKKYIKIFEGELRFFLISIAVISLFSKSSECGYFEKIIEECKESEEVINISQNFIEKLKEIKEIKKEETEEDFYLQELFKEDLEGIKIKYLEKIRNLKINVKELDVELNWKEKTWKERSNFKSLILDPRRKLIINPLNLISNIFINFFNNKHKFIIDVIIKIIICNLITLLIVKKNDHINNNLKNEEEMIKDLRKGLGDLFINALFAILSSHVFFTSEKEPNFIKEISKLNWITAVIIINNFIPYLARKLKKEEKSDFSQFIIDLLISTYFFNSISGGKNSIFLYLIINSIVSTILYLVSNLINKKKQTAIIKDECEEPEL